MAKLNKIITEAEKKNQHELQLIDKGINSFTEIPNLSNLTNLTRLSLAHNKIKSLPPSIGNLKLLTHLSLFNNHLQDLPTSLMSLENLISLNLSMNKLKNLPHRFVFPSLEILDLSYNNLNEHSIPDTGWL